MSANQHVVVLGAGPAGLMAATVLADAGVRTTVLEAAPFVGGLSRTLMRETEHGTFRFDIGGHRWTTGDPVLEALFDEVIGRDAVTVNRLSRIWIGGKRVEYPLRLPSALKPLGPVDSARAIREVASRAARPPVLASNATMEQAYLALYGRTLYDTYIRPYSAKVWGRDPDSLSGDWVGARSTPVVSRSSMHRFRGTDPASTDRFRYPAGGFGMLAERLAARVEQRGQRVLLRLAVERVLVDDRRVTALQVRTERGVETLAVDTVISSLPVPIFTRILHPTPPEGVLEAARTLPFRDLITVNLMVSRAQIIPETWLYIHDPEVPFTRIHEPKNWSREMVPGDDVTSLVIEYPCERGDPIWNLRDEELVSQTIHWLITPLALLRADDVIGGFTLRATKAYPVFERGYEDRVERIQAHLRQFRNLQFVGRGGSFRYLDSDQSMESGWRAARQVIEGPAAGDPRYSEAENAAKPPMQEDWHP